MNYENFFTFDFGNLNKAAILIENSDTIINKREFLSGREKHNLCISYKFHTGSLLYDVVGTSRTIPLISERLKDYLIENNFSGWKAERVKIIGRDGNFIEKHFYHLIVYGKCGDIDDNLSAIIEKPPIIPTGKPYKVRKGIYFDPGTWDGSDFFLATNNTNVFVTKKVALALFKAKPKFKNLKIESVNDYEYTIGII